MDEYDETIRAGWVAVLGLVTGGASQAEGGDRHFSSYWSDFLAAAGGGLPLADFEGLGGNTYQTLSSSIEPSIPAGVTFSSNRGTTQDLFVVPAGFDGNPAITTDALFANGFGTPLVVDFSPVVTAVGSDLIAYTCSGATATIAVAVREAGGAIST